VARGRGFEQAGNLSVGDRAKLFESAEQVAHFGGWEWLPGLDEPRWSDNVYRIFGREPGEIQLTAEFVLEQAHPDDRERLAAYVELIESVGDPPPIEFRIQQPGRGVRYLRSTIVAIEWRDRSVARIAGVIQDVTNERRADREIAAYVAVSRDLARWDSFDRSGRGLLRGIGEAMGFVFGAFWLPERDLLRARLTWRDSSLPLVAEVEAATLSLEVPRGVGLLGRVWERAEPVVITDVLADPDCRRSGAGRARLRGAVAFPALCADGVLAVLEFYHPDECPVNSRLTRTLSAIGNELGAFLSRRQGELRSALLTPRELQVLQLVANGYSRAEIARRLTVSTSTVATHMKNIFERLGVRDRASAVAIGIRLGLIE
jgi:DNA-binding CsgD family transcriptional regulator